jgi:hypothetical protein
MNKNKSFFGALIACLILLAPLANSHESGLASDVTPVKHDHGPGPDRGPDPGPEPGPDRGPDPGPDPGPEPGPDRGPDPGPEPGPDPGPGR